ncbi:thiol:disulfide interchange protein DsbA/DsbL, partial [Xanthomonas hortorum pv. gardneri]
MKTRFALTLMALLPILVACKAQDGSSDTAPAAATPAAETAPAPAAAAPATDPAAPPAVGESASTPPAATPSAAPRAPNGPEPVAGTDYLDIEGGQPYQQAAGQIVGDEVFGYVC